MSNVNFAGRSNYVKVKDHAGLSKSLSIFSHLSLESGKDGKYCILSKYDSSFCQSAYVDDEEGGEYEVELKPEIHIIPFLEDNEIFIIIEVQNDKLRWLYGWAEAYQGSKRLTVNLEDIYKKIEQEWGTDEYTTAQY
jgi:hypothetical protein